MHTFREYVEWLESIGTLDSFNQWLQTKGSNLTSEHRSDYEEFLNMMENSPVWLQADPSVVQDILVKNGFQEREGARSICSKPRFNWEPQTETTVFKPAVEGLGYSMIQHSYSVDPDPLKAFLYGKRRVSFPENRSVYAPRDLFEWLDDSPPREGGKFQGQIDLRFNNWFVTQGNSFSGRYKTKNEPFRERLEKAYLEHRRDMLGILGEIVERGIPAVWFGRGLGNKFCLVNP